MKRFRLTAIIVAVPALASCTKMPSSPTTCAEAVHEELAATRVCIAGCPRPETERLVALQRLSDDLCWQESEARKEREQRLRAQAAKEVEQVHPEFLKLPGDEFTARLHQYQDDYVKEHSPQ